ncbi:MAG: heme exporter protein CcmB [Parvibaculales bacterium]
MAQFLALSYAQMQMSWRQGHIMQAVSFLLIAVILLPFGLGAQLAQLNLLASGLLWVALLMAVLLSLDTLFQADIEDGHFDQLIGLDLPLETVVLAKLSGYFIAIMVPLLASVPLAALLLNLSVQNLWPLMVAMLVGTPALLGLGGIGAALAVSVPRGGLLMVLLVMPLYVPIMIFGAGAANQAVDNVPDMTALAILGLISLAALLLSPIAIAAILRSALR